MDDLQQAPRCARIGGITVHYQNHLEATVLQLLDWKMHVTRGVLRVPRGTRLRASEVKMILSENRYWTCDRHINHETMDATSQFAGYAWITQFIQV